MSSSVRLFGILYLNVLLLDYGFGIGQHGVDFLQMCTFRVIVSEGIAFVHHATESLHPLFLHALHGQLILGSHYHHGKLLSSFR